MIQITLMHGDRNQSYRYPSQEGKLKKNGEKNGDDATIVPISFHVPNTGPIHVYSFKSMELTSGYSEVII